MTKIPAEVAGFVALPVLFPTTKSQATSPPHFLYLKPHDPSVPSEETSRSLFTVNIPISTTPQSLKVLFTTNLDGGVVEKIHFREDAPEISAARTGKSRKRKRITAEEIAAGMDTHSLPKIWDSEIHKSGATAIVVFVDRPAMELSLKAARRAGKQGTPISWPEDESAPLGLIRYENHKALQFPSPKALLRSVNAYMTSYSQLEESRSRENARKRALPDEDGFVTVTRGSRGSVRMDEAKEVADRQREKEKERAKGTEDFYRFQMRERRKEREVGLVRRFEEDRRRVDEMRGKRRGVGEGR